MERNRKTLPSNTSFQNLQTITSEKSSSTKRKPPEPLLSIKLNKGITKSLNFTSNSNTPRQRSQFVSNNYNIPYKSSKKVFNNFYNIFHPEIHNNIVSPNKELAILEQENMKLKVELFEKDLKIKELIKENAKLVERVNI